MFVVVPASRIYYIAVLKQRLTHDGHCCRWWCYKCCCSCYYYNASSVCPRLQYSCSFMLSDDMSSDSVIRRESPPVIIHWWWLWQSDSFLLWMIVFVLPLVVSVWVVAENRWISWWWHFYVFSDLFLMLFNFLMLHSSTLLLKASVFKD